MIEPDRLLWSLAKGAQSASAHVRVIPGVGLELRFSWNGELAHSQVYRNADDLAGVAQAKREDLKARGWMTGATPDPRD
jgi:hypothetical protein